MMNANDKRTAISETVQLHAYFNLIYKLVEKGILSQEDGAAIMVENANDARLATEKEDKLSAEFGGKLALFFEGFAATLLGRSKFP